MTPTSCSNCRNVELEIVEMKNFISRWFDVFSRRFDDQDRKLTILVDAVSAVNNDYSQNNHCHDKNMTANHEDADANRESVVVDDGEEEFCEVEEEEVKNAISYYEEEQPEFTENHSPSSVVTCQPLVHGNSSSVYHQDNGISHLIQVNDDQSDPTFTNVEPVYDSNIHSSQSTDLKNCVQNIFDFYNPSLMPTDDLTPISLVHDNNSIFSDLFNHVPPTASSSSSMHSVVANSNDAFHAADSQPGTSTNSSTSIHHKHARKRIGGFGGVRPLGTKFQSMYPSINNLLKRKLIPPKVENSAPSSSTQANVEVRTPNVVRIKDRFRSSLPHADQTRPSTSSSLAHFKTRSPLKGDIGSVKTKFCETCPICSKRFSSVYGMNRHKKVKHNERGVLKFKCKFCNKTYAWNSDLLKHINLAHKNDAYSLGLGNETF